MVARGDISARRFMPWVGQDAGFGSRGDRTVELGGHLKLRMLRRLASTENSESVPALEFLSLYVRKYHLG